jgi:hypothetical protein
LPVPGGLRKLMTSRRSTNWSSARARTYSRSSEGWNEKSKPARVIIASHAQYRLEAAGLAHARLLGETRVDLRRVRAGHRVIEHFQSARGVLRAIKVRRTRSRTGRASPIPVTADRFPRQAFGRPLRENRVTSRHDIADAANRDRRGLRRDPLSRHSAMAGSQAALMASFEAPIESVHTA